MFNIGGGELIVILLIALIVLGPSRLPDAARTIGKTMGELRRLSSSFQNEVRTALDTADDPKQVGTRREVLTGQGPDAPATPGARPPRTQPLVAAPAPVDEPAASPVKPARATTSPAAKPAVSKAATTKKAEPKNGTAVKKATAAKAAPRRTKSP